MHEYFITRRVTRSFLGAETYAFGDAYDFAYCAKKDLEALLERNVYLKMITDSKSLFDVITQCSQTLEKRLMIDLQSVRDAYQCHEISNIGFVRGPNNLADGMTKTGNREQLFNLLRTGKADFEVEQWVLRLKNEKNSINPSSKNDYQQGLNHSTRNTAAKNVKPPKKINLKKNDSRHKKQREK